MAPRSALLFVSSRGAKPIGPGVHALCAEEKPAPAPESDDPAVVLEKGVALYYETLSLFPASGQEPGDEERAKLERAEALLRRVRDHEGATEAQRSRGHFFLYASIGRQGRHAEAAKEAARWVESYPDDPSRHCTLFFVGVYHERAGDLVSTFGRTDVATVYRVPPERSLCLAMIDAGAAAFLCPIGANHGYRVRGKEVRAVFSVTFR